MAELPELIKEAYETVYSDIPNNSRWTPVETAGKIVEAVISSPGFIEHFIKKHGLISKENTDETVVVTNDTRYARKEDILFCKNCKFSLSDHIKDLDYECATADGNHKKFELEDEIKQIVVKNKQIRKEIGLVGLSNPELLLLEFGEELDEDEMPKDVKRLCRQRMCLKAHDELERREAEIGGQIDFEREINELKTQVVERKPPMDTLIKTLSNKITEKGLIITMEGSQVTTEPTVAKSIRASLRLKPSQTIMELKNSTGRDIEEVKKALNEMEHQCVLGCGTRKETIENGGTIYSRTYSLM